MQPPGGGNGLAAWMLQALAEEHEVTVLSWRPVDVAPIDRFFGTSLGAARFASHVVPTSWRLPVDGLPVPASLLRTSVLMRYTRRVSDGFDVIIGAHNETDYGRRGIQYVHYPAYLRPRPAVDLRWYHLGPVLTAYYATADRLAGFSVARMKSNLTLANSDWTASKIAASLGIHADTLYPPVISRVGAVPWSGRQRGFVAMGRISPEKEYERVIRILANVQRRIPDITLTIIGTYDRATNAYFKSLTSLVASIGAERWVSFRRNLSRDDVDALLASHRYGIHGMREEHFGMAPAEMVRAGMIVWVPNGGGQVEIVGDEPLLRYDSEDQATEHILRVLGDVHNEKRLRDRLAHHSEQFSSEHFVSAIRYIVATFKE
jgi:glycosyltransferase involved in cell wall biosynthesis